MKLKRLLLIAVLAIVGIIGIFAVIVALQPAEYKITRSATIAAPQSTVFAQVNDYHKWNAWSPWAKLDPNCKYTFSGPDSGVGAVFAWAGNDKVGEGKMTITDSKPNESIRMNLDFIKPFADSCITDFTFKPEGAGTAVTWTMAGHKNFVSKAFCLFMDMDKMVGGDFEKGLASMKALAEAGPTTAPAAQ
jgi:hypothetical protein